MAVPAHVQHRHLPAPADNYRNDTCPEIATTITAIFLSIASSIFYFIALPPVGAALATIGTWGILYLIATNIRCREPSDPPASPEICPSPLRSSGRHPPIRRSPPRLFASPEGRLPQHQRPGSLSASQTYSSLQRIGRLDPRLNDPDYVGHAARRLVMAQGGHARERSDSSASASSTNRIVVQSPGKAFMGSVFQHAAQEAEENEHAEPLTTRISLTHDPFGPGSGELRLPVGAAGPSGPRRGVFSRRNTADLTREMVSRVIPGQGRPTASAAVSPAGPAERNRVSVGSGAQSRGGSMGDHYHYRSASMPPTARA